MVKKWIGWGGGSNHALTHNTGNWTIYYLPTQTYFSLNKYSKTIVDTIETQKMASYECRWRGGRQL